MPAANTIEARLDAAGLEILPAAGGGVAVRAQTACAASNEVQRHPLNGTHYPNMGALVAAAQRLGV